MLMATVIIETSPNTFHGRNRPRGQYRGISDFNKTLHNDPALIGASDWHNTIMLVATPYNDPSTSFEGADSLT
jgi:hypothetical protein